MRAERLLAAVVLLGCAANASADAVGRCRTALALGAVRYAEAGVRALRACLAQDGTLFACPPGGVDLGPGVVRACCGPDGTCGTADDLPAAAIGWSVPQCPGFADGGCTNSISGPAGVSACLACVAGAATRRAVTAGAGDASGEQGDACRVAGAQAGAKRFVVALRGLRRCLRHGGDPRSCAAAGVPAPPARAFCRACGGSDRRCGGGDDVAPGAVGLPPTCTGAGDACAASLADATDVAACGACVATFAAGCLGDLAVAGAAGDAAACHPGIALCAAGVPCTGTQDCPFGYECADNGGGVRSCVGPPCTRDLTCVGGSVCRQHCAVDGCDGRRCQCPGFGCTGSAELCLDDGDGTLACRKRCTQDSDCVEPFGAVCVNSRFGAGLCIGSKPCQ